MLVSHARDILGVGPNASLEDIEQAWAQDVAERRARNDSVAAADEARQILIAEWRRGNVVEPTPPKDSPPRKSLGRRLVVIVSLLIIFALAGTALQQKRTALEQEITALKQEITSLEQEIAVAQEPTVQQSLPGPPILFMASHTTEEEDWACLSKLEQGLNKAQVEDLTLGDYYSYSGYIGSCAIAAKCLRKNPDASVQDVTVTAACNNDEDPLSLAESINEYIQEDDFFSLPPPPPPPF